MDAGQAEPGLSWAAVQAEGQDRNVATGTNASLPLLSSIMDPGLALERSAAAARVPGPAQMSVVAKCHFSAVTAAENFGTSGFSGSCIVLGGGLKDISVCYYGGEQGVNQPLQASAAQLPGMPVRTHRCLAVLIHARCHPACMLTMLRLLRHAHRWPNGALQKAVKQRPEGPKEEAPFGADIQPTHIRFRGQMQGDEPKAKKEEAQEAGEV